MADAVELNEELRAVDLSFPVASDLSIVAEARAELMRRRGGRSDAITYLTATADMMAKSNLPCARTLRDRAKRYRAAQSR